MQTRKRFSNEEKKLMLLSGQTLLGLKITGSVNLKLCVYYSALLSILLACIIYSEVICGTGEVLVLSARGEGLS